MPRPRKFPIAEVFIVVIVVSALLLLMLPSVQTARESTRGRAQIAEGISTGHVSKTASSQLEDKQVKARFVYFQAPTSPSRRIIFEADITLVVKQVTDTEAQITKYLKQVDGYIAEASVDRMEGQELTGRWKVRVPVAKFDSFLDEVAKLGVAESRRQTAQDVTEEYVDLEAQITNKKRLEERIVALLKDSSGKIKDVIEVENELGRVRGEIERMEGRLRFLTSRTDFTTISISAREQENYVPPEAPGFINRVAQAWNSSILSLRESAEQITVAAVFVFPWLAALSVVAIPVLIYVRKYFVAGRSSANVATPQSL